MPGGDVVEWGIVLVIAFDTSRSHRLTVPNDFFFLLNLLNLLFSVCWSLQSGRVVAARSNYHS